MDTFNAQQAKTNIKKFYRKHRVQPMEHGITDGYTTCSCGAEWRTYYSAGNHYTWSKLNAKCESHDIAQAQLPSCPRCGVGALGIDGEMLFCDTCNWDTRILLKPV